MSITAVDDQAERALMVLLASPEMEARALLHEALGKVSPGDFTRPIYAQLWQAAVSLSGRGEPVNTPRVIAEAARHVSRKDTRQGAEPGATVPHSWPAEEAIREFQGSFWTHSDIATAVKVLPELARRRALLRILDKARADAAVGDVGEVAASVHNDLQVFARSNTENDHILRFDAALDAWWEWQNNTDGNNARVIPTPWMQANDFLSGGLHTGRSYVVAARPGDGKSLMLSNMAAHAANEGFSVLVFSAEMPTREVTSRIIADQADVAYSSITRRDLGGVDVDLVNELRDRADGWELRICDRPGMSIEQVHQACRSVKQSTGSLDVVCVDYLQLIRESDSRVSRERQVAHISRTLKLISRELECAVVSACQLNRSAAEKRPEVHDLRESGSIEQDCDVAILIHHEMAHGERTGLCDFIYAKNRTGRRGASSMRFLPAKARIS